MTSPRAVSFGRGVGGPRSPARRRASWSVPCALENGRTRIDQPNLFPKQPRPEEVQLTTTTDTPTTDAFANIAAIREQVEAARADRERLGDEATAYFREVEQASAELDHLARSATEQFGSDGQPKPKSKAAALKKKVEDSRQSSWPAILQGADQAIVKLDGELRDLLNANCVELARQEYDRGLDGVRRVQSLAAAMRDAIGAMRATEPALLEIVTAIGMPLDGRDVAVDPRWQELERMLDSLAELEPARIAALTPYSGEQPRKVRTPSGEWSHAGGAERPEDQPPPMERPS